MFFRKKCASLRRFCVESFLTIKEENPKHFSILLKYMKLYETLKISHFFDSLSLFSLSFFLFRVPRHKKKGALHTRILSLSLSFSTKEKTLSTLALRSLSNDEGNKILCLAFHWRRRYIVSLSLVVTEEEEFLDIQINPIAL